jgi:hypothetical protein
MKNPDVIAISGFSRGGTSIAWNILNSHPGVCAPLIETNQIVERNLVLRTLFRFPTSMRGRRGRVPRWWVDRSLYSHKMAALGHVDLVQMSANSEYAPEDASASALALKSIDGGVRLTDGLLGVYPNLAVICVVRDGRAVLEGAVRRGMDPGVVGRRYAQNGAKMVELALRHRRSMILRFEDILADPFGTARAMYSFAGLPELYVASLRLKAKGVVQVDGAHRPRFGEIDRYYWFSPLTISDALDPTVNETQISQLDPKAFDEFMSHAEPVMRHFGYAD